jgi:hypothetical protein
MLSLAQPQLRQLDYKLNKEYSSSPQSPATSCSSSIASSDDGGKITKPDGEPGHPGWGGYNLEAALGWDSGYYQKMKVQLFFVSFSPIETAFRNVCID